MRGLDAIAALFARTNREDFGLRFDLRATSFGEIEIIVIQRILRPDTTTRHARASMRTTDARGSFTAEIRIGYFAPRFSEKYRDVGGMKLLFLSDVLCNFAQNTIAGSYQRVCTRAE